LRLAPLGAALRQTRPAISRLSADSARLKEDVAKALKDWESLKEQAAGGEVPEEMRKAFSERVDAIMAKDKELEAAADAFEQSEAWQSLRKADTGSKGFQKIIRWIPGWLVIAVGVVVWVGLAVLTPDFPAGFINLLAWAIAGFVAPWFAERRGGYLSLTGLVTTVAAVLFCTAIASGLAGVVGGEYVADYSFKRDAQIANGQFVHLAETNGLLFLQSCRTKSVVAVNTSDVANFEQVSYRPLPFGPSLVGIVFKRQRPMLGYRPDCQVP
jgi:hypothetical protein